MLSNKNGGRATSAGPALATSLLRWVAIPAAALGFWSVATLAGITSFGVSLDSAPKILPGSLTTASLFARPDLARHVTKSARGAGAFDEKSTRRARLSAAAGSKLAKVEPRQSFDQMVAAAALSPDKLLAAFNRAGLATPAAIAAAERFDRIATGSIPAFASADRFGPQGAPVEASAPLALALLDLGDDDAGLAPSLEDPLEGIDADPEFATVPDAVPLPDSRPRGKAVAKAVEADEPADRDKPERAEKPGRAVAEKPDRAVVEKPDRAVVEKPARAIAEAPRSRSSRDSGGTVLAYAKPDRLGGDGGAFRNLFSRPNRQAGTAVYDISAGTVTMPDGTKLEAHSGIGDMADNPAYAHKKMKGPTPPDTYKLVMRETRFHGVEAIRMLPVDGKVKLGRTGLLAHSELLRGRKGQSHGCVAFKDYNRFLAAFKRGKVTHMVVVPGRKQPTRVAQAGRDV